MGISPEIFGEVFRDVGLSKGEGMIEWGICFKPALNTSVARAIICQMVQGGGVGEVKGSSVSWESASTSRGFQESDVRSVAGHILVPGGVASCNICNGRLEKFRIFGMGVRRRKWIYSLPMSVTLAVMLILKLRLHTKPNNVYYLTALTLYK